jgi:spermidine/putrescine ABC transporter ATP-binding subunit
LQTLDLDIEEGEFLTLLGPSGCGKTTTLRLIAGFITPSAGDIYLGDAEITHLPPQKRDVGMVFQDYALFPHMTIFDNIAFGLTERGVDKDTIRNRVSELLDLVRLPEVADRFPAQMSGGQQQRIAVARAVAYTPKVLLMDEPLGALDLKLRESMQHELRRIQQELGITAVYVTHDQSEAMNMSDRIAVMNLGLLEQVGTAEEIYESPATQFVADFVGQINFLPAEVLGSEGSVITVETLGQKLQAPLAPDAPASGNVKLAIRPERLHIEATGSAGDGRQGLSGRVRDIQFAGNLIRIFVAVGDDHDLIVETRPKEVSAEIGADVLVSWDLGDARLLAD